MTDGTPIVFTGHCGVPVTITPRNLAQVPADGIPDAELFRQITDPGGAHPEWVEHVPTWWTVEYGDGPPCGAQRLRLAVVSANAASGGSCAIECARPCPVAEIVATVEYVDHIVQ